VPQVQTYFADHTVTDRSFCEFREHKCVSPLAGTKIKKQHRSVQPNVIALYLFLSLFRCQCANHPHCLEFSLRKERRDYCECRAAHNDAAKDHAGERELARVNRPPTCWQRRTTRFEKNMTSGTWVVYTFTSGESSIKFQTKYIGAVESITVPFFLEGVLYITRTSHVSISVSKRMTLEP